MASAAAVADATESGDDVAKLLTLSYEKLTARDPQEEARLLEACSRYGFFYLDIGTSPAGYTKVVDDLFDFSRQYFAKPLEEKKRDTNDDWATFNICGYKPMGLDTGNVNKQKDGCEGMRIPADLHFSPGKDSRLHQPQGVQSEWPRFANFIQHSHDITHTLLSSLSDSFALTGDQRFECFHQARRLSTTTAVLQGYPYIDDLPANTSVGHFTHTDTGSLTILFNTTWGLQVFSDETQSWSYVAPRPGHAIVNVGDGLRFLSGFRLKSSLHRVVPSHSRWTSGPRYAVIFFLRPDNEAEFEDSEGQRWTAERWLNRKFSGYRGSHEEQSQNAVSTGKTGFVGLWEDTSQKLIDT